MKLRIKMPHGTSLPYEILSTTSDVVHSGVDDDVAINLDPGSYLVRAWLPSGRLMHRTVQLADEPVNIRLRPRLKRGGRAAITRGTENYLPFHRNIESNKNQHTEDIEIGLWKKVPGGGWRSLRLRRRVVGLRFASEPAHGALRFLHVRRGRRIPYSLICLPVDDATITLGDVQHASLGTPDSAVDAASEESQESMLLEAALSPTEVDATVAAAGSNRWGDMLLNLRSLGDRRGARLIAKRALAGKMADPITAAVGAFYLLNQGELDFRPGWYGNLASSFDWLPDGAIAQAWQGLRSGNMAPEEARNLFMEAANRGIPAITEGLQLLHEGLSIFSDDAEVESCLLDWYPVWSRADWSSPRTLLHWHMMPPGMHGPPDSERPIHPYLTINAQELCKHNGTFHIE